MGGVLDQGDAVVLGDRPDLAQVAGLARMVDRDDGLRRRRDRQFELLGI